MLWEQINVDTILKKDKIKRHSLFLTIIIQTPYFKCDPHKDNIIIIIRIITIVVVQTFLQRRHTTLIKSA